MSTGLPKGRSKKLGQLTVAPTVNINTFDGGIWVHPSKTGVVTAVFELHSTCKNGTFAMAEKTVKAIEVKTEQRDNEIRVQTRVIGELPNLCFPSTSTHLYAPVGSRLIVQTSGSTWVSGAPSEVVVRNNVRGAVSADFEVGPSSAASAPADTKGVFAVMNGSVFLDGRMCGKVGRGDHIKFAQDGKLFVNEVLLLQ